MTDPSAHPPAAKVPRTAAVIVVITVALIVGLSLWYLVQPQPLLVQGEADATRIDIAARVDGRVAKRPVERGENVTAGQILVEIDNPQLLTKLREAEAARAVALADFTRIEVGTRAEVIAPRKAALAASAGRRNAGAADLRSHQAADRARLCARAEARRGHARARCRPTRRRAGEVRLRRGRRRLHARGARRRQGGCRQGRGVGRHAAGAGRRAHRQGAGRRRRSTRSAASSANMSRRACRFCRWSTSATSGCASTCARISSRA